METIVDLFIWIGVVFIANAVWDLTKDVAQIKKDISKLGTSQEDKE